MSERITWLLPIKNGMPYLRETLASIEAQTYRNWEILAWDNGSTDGTIDELKAWIPSRLPGRVVTGKPLSVGASLAEMVKQCKTELCARIDADDVNLPERIERQVEFLLAHPEVAVVGTQMNRLDQRGVNYGLFYPYSLYHDDIVHFMLLTNGMSHPTVLFRRSVVLLVGNYQDVPNVEDYDLWLRVAAHHKLANLDVPLLNYRVHDKSYAQTAIVQNRLTRLADECFCKNAPLLYGCSESEARLLRERKHPCAIKVLYQIAQHLQHSQNSELTDRFKSDSFIKISRQLVSSKDIVSRLALAALDSHRMALPKELASIGEAGLKHLGLHQFVEVARHYKNTWQWNLQLQKWLKDHKRRNTRIHPTIEFIGVKSPLNLELVEIGSYCKIDKDVTIWLSPDEGAEPKLVMKNSSSAGRNTYFNVFKPITIGECALIGPYSYINSGNHRYASRDLPIMEQGFVGAPIVIEDDAWLGTHVVVLPGVTIGKGAIVGAGSVVTKDIPAYEVWAGVPARFIKRRPD